MRNRPGLLRNHHYYSIGFLAQSNGRPMPCSQRLVEVLPLRQWKDASRICYAVALNDDPSVMYGVVRKEYRFEHFRRRLAIHLDARFNGFLELDGLFNRDQGADAHVCQAL